MVMLFNRLLKERKGQLRILEAVIAVAILFIVFSVSMFLINISNVRVLQERADLDRLGYNVLHRLVESNIIEEVLKTPELRGERLKTIVQEALPYTIYFNITIYNCLDLGSWISLQPLTTISNAPENSLVNSLEVSSINMIYTSKEGYIYNIVLVLARAGGG